MASLYFYCDASSRRIISVVATQLTSEQKGNRIELVISDQHAAYSDHLRKIHYALNETNDGLTLMEGALDHAEKVNYYTSASDGVITNDMNLDISGCITEEQIIDTIQSAIDNAETDAMKITMLKLALKSLALFCIALSNR